MAKAKTAAPAKGAPADATDPIARALLSQDRAELREAISTMDDARWARLAEGTALTPGAYPTDPLTLTFGKTLTKEVAPASRDDVALMALRKTGQLDGITEVILYKSKLTSLDAIEGLSSLTRLTLWRADALEELSLDALPSLEHVELTELKALKKLVVRATPKLAKIELQDNKALERVEIVGPNAIAELDLHHSNKLASLDLRGATALRSLTINAAAMAPEALSAIACPRLSALHVTYAKAKTLELPRAENVPSLKTLSVQRSASSAIGSLSKHAKLESIELWLLNRLKSLDGLKGCPSLRELSVIGCEALSDVTALATLPALVSLTLSEVSAPVSVVASLSGLRALRLGVLAEPLGSVAPLASLTGLESLALIDPSLASIEGIQSLRALTSLELRKGTVTSLALLSGLASLAKLEVTSNEALSSIDGIPSLPALRSVALEYLPKLSSLAPLSSLPALQELSVIDAPSLSPSELALIGTLSGLKSLQLFTLPALTEVSFLAKLSGLERLSLCTEELRSIDGLERCRALTSLSLNGCRALPSVEGLRAMTWLTELDLRYCDRLSRYGRHLESSSAIAQFFADQ
jgi:hypothetical protein